MSTDATPGALASMLASLECEPPVSDAALADLLQYVRERFEAPLPDDYIAFLRVANGADGEFENGYSIVLWKAELLPEVTRDFQTEEWMPGCLVIGSDAGDLVYGIDMRRDAPTKRYLETEDNSMDWDYILWRGGSFADLIARRDRPHRGGGWFSRLRRRQP